jgi:hypothetical protein
MSLENATGVEIGWTVIALLGVAGCLWLVREALRDLRVAHRLDPLTHLLGTTSVVIIGLVGISLSILAGIGVRAMLLPPPPSQVDRGTVLVGVGLVVLGVCQIGIVGVKSWQRIEARRIYGRETERLKHE